MLYSLQGISWKNNSCDIVLLQNVYNNIFTVHNICNKRTRTVTSKSMQHRHCTRFFFYPKHRFLFNQMSIRFLETLLKPCHVWRHRRYTHTYALHVHRLQITARVLGLNIYCVAYINIYTIYSYTRVIDVSYCNYHSELVLSALPTAGPCPSSRLPNRAAG